MDEFKTFSNYQSLVQLFKYIDDLWKVNLGNLFFYPMHKI